MTYLIIGVATTECLINISRALPSTTCWASGGIRNGLDVAKSMCLGASAVGIAGRLLQPITESTNAVLKVMKQFRNSRATCSGLVLNSGRSEYFTYFGRYSCRFRKWLGQIPIVGMRLKRKPIGKMSFQ